MPRLSIVIPCLGGASDFEDTLVAVLQNRPPRCEVLVVHTHPYDDPYDLRDEVQFIRVSGKPNLAELANTGLEAARGEVLHVLGCRLNVPEGWAETALAHFDESDAAAVSPLIISPHDQRIVAAGVSYGGGGTRRIIGGGLQLKARRLDKLKVAGPTLDAGFYRRDVLLAVGGWHESLGASAADIDLAQTLAALDLPTVVATNCRIQERSPAQRQGGFTHGRALERLFWRQAIHGSSPFALVRHALAVGTDFACRLSKGDALTTLLGRLVGLLNRGAASEYRETLDMARQVLAGETETLSLAEAREQQHQARSQANNVNRRAA